MIAKLIGKDKVLQGDAGKKSGKPYYCQNVYLTHSKPGVEGLVARQQFISFLDFPHAKTMSVGDTLSLDFDGEGNLLGIEILSSTTSATPSMSFPTKK